MARYVLSFKIDSTFHNFSHFTLLEYRNIFDIKYENFKIKRLTTCPQERRLQIGPDTIFIKEGS